MPFINIGGNSSAAVPSNAGSDANATIPPSPNTTPSPAVNPLVLETNVNQELAATAAPSSDSQPLTELNTLTLLEPSIPESLPEEKNTAEIKDLGLATSVSEADINLEVKSNTETADLQIKNYQLKDILQQAINLGASDLHLSSGYRAKIRVNGLLQDINSQILSSESIANLLTDVLEQSHYQSLQDDMDLAYQLPDTAYRFRVNVFRQKGNWSAAFRLIPTHISSIEELKLPPILREFTKFSNGLVLVTGPTGSGKSSTIAAMVNEINLNKACHIISIEDPVEYVYPSGLALVDQRAVGIDTKDWSTALRGALRQDPDIVMVGEMRDFETIKFALQLAETGHLVFSTLHTNSAAQTIDRIIDVFPEFQQSQIRTQLSSVLMAVVSQKLVNINNSSRQVAAEIMVVNPAIRNLIREQKAHQIDNIIQTGADLGMISMEKSLVSLVREGKLSTVQAQQYANKPDDILSLLGQNNK